MKDGECNILGEGHVGPIENAIGSSGDAIGGRGDEFLVDVCRNCGYEWPLTWLSPERREQYRRAERAWTSRPKERE